MNNHYSLAIEYYSNWLDVEPEHLQSKGIYIACTPEREKRQIGYGMIFPLYCMCRDDLLIITHCAEYQSQIQRIVSLLDGRTSTNALDKAIRDVFGRDPGHGVKHYFTSLPKGIDTSRVIQLTPDHYPDYLRFHSRQYPNANQETWLAEYFKRIAASGMVHAIFEGTDIVSSAGAPDVPYMPDKIVTPGINTLESYRRKGYATSCAFSQIQHILSAGKTPLWSCSANNIGSSRLAARVGFKTFAEMVTLSAPA